MVHRIIYSKIYAHKSLIWQDRDPKCRRNPKKEGGILVREKSNARLEQASCSTLWYVIEEKQEGEEEKILLGFSVWIRSLTAI